MYLYIYLFIYFSIYLAIHVAIHLAIYLPINLSIHLSLSTFLYIHLSTVPVLAQQIFSCTLSCCPNLSTRLMLACTGISLSLPELLQSVLSSFHTLNKKPCKLTRTMNISDNPSGEFRQPQPNQTVGVDRMKRG